MILELAHTISVIWPNQLQNRTQRNVHARVYTNKIRRVINQWKSSTLHSGAYIYIYIYIYVYALEYLLPSGNFAMDDSKY